MVRKIMSIAGVAIIILFAIDHDANAGPAEISTFFEAHPPISGGRVPIRSETSDDYIFDGLSAQSENREYRVSHKHPTVMAKIGNFKVVSDTDEPVYIMGIMMGALDDRYPSRDVPTKTQIILVRICKKGSKCKDKSDVIATIPSLPIRYSSPMLEPSDWLIGAIKKPISLLAGSKKEFDIHANVYSFCNFHHKRPGSSRDVPDMTPQLTQIYGLVVVASDPDDPETYKYADFSRLMGEGGMSMDPITSSFGRLIDWGDPSPACHLMGP